MSESFHLTVRLERDPGHLHVSYHHPRYGEIGRAGPVAWSALTPAFAFGGQTGLDALNLLLDRGEEAELEEHLSGHTATQLGELLFSVLFPDEAVWRRVLCTVFEMKEADRPNPPRHPVRLRVAGADPALLGLPFRLCSWHGRLLIDDGWTFAAATGEQARGQVSLHLPCKVLLLAPQHDGMSDLGTGGHMKGLREVCERVSRLQAGEQFLRLVHSRAELGKALKGMRPDLLYYYGHGSVRGGQLCLHLGGPGEPLDPFPITDLRPLLDSAYPEGTYLKMAYFNGCMTGASGWHAAGHQLGPRVPVVVAQRTTSFTRGAQRAALRWLNACLVERLDPVSALHRPDPAGTRRDFQWLTPTVHAGYDAWSTREGGSAGPDPESHLRVDRHKQKAEVAKHVRELLGSHSRRVQSLVVYAAQGNCLPDFPWQALDYLQRHEKVRVRRLTVPLPAARAGLRQRLPEELRLALESDPSEPPQHALRRAGHDAGAQLLWLDFGSLQGAAEGKQLIATLEDWLVFCQDHLCRHCPEELRLIAYLAVELLPERHARLQEKMEDDWVVALYNDRFECSVLPALGEVKLIDLIKHLSDPGNTRCPPQDARRAAELIHRRTRGGYEETIQWIKKGDQGTWYDVVRELERPQDREELI